MLLYLCNTSVESYELLQVFVILRLIPISIYCFQCDFVELVILILVLFVVETIWSLIYFICRVFHGLE